MIASWVLLLEELQQAVERHRSGTNRARCIIFLSSIGQPIELCRSTSLIET